MLKENIVLSVNNVSKKYYKSNKKRTSEKEVFWALKNISFEVEKGKILGIIGANGAGKSTLLKILSEVVPPSEGSIEHSGTILSILEIGTGFHSDLSGYENIFLNASLLGMKKKEIQKISPAIIDFSGIADFIHEPVKTYSSGMYLRLALSIALFVDFEIILLDEVISVGDAEFRFKAIQKIKEKTREGKTCIIISHDLQSIISLCDHCVIIEKGEIKFDGTARSAVTEYLDKVNERVNSSTVQITEHEKCKFISAELIKESFFMDEPIELKIRYEKKVEKDIDIVLKIRDYSNYILTDCEIYRPSYIEKELPLGVYETKCLIPANLFNQGNYFIDLLFGDKVSTVLNVRSVAKFSVKLRSWEEKKRWNEVSEGIPFRPICNWEIKPIEN